MEGGEERSNMPGRKEGEGGVRVEVMTVLHVYVPLSSLSPLALSFDQNMTH